MNSTEQDQEQELGKQEDGLVVRPQQHNYFKSVHETSYSMLDDMDSQAGDAPVNPYLEHEKKKK